MSLSELLTLPSQSDSFADPADLALMAIGSWHQPALFLSAEAQTIFWMNVPAELCLREHGVSVVGKRIHLPERSKQKDFERFLSVTGLETGSWILDLAGGDGALIFRCRRLEETGFNLLTIHSPSSPSTFLPDVGGLLGLTPSESRVVNGLVSGRRADDLADDLGVGLETVRTHIRRIYFKTGVGSREQLIAKVNSFRVP